MAKKPKKPKGKRKRKAPPMEDHGVPASDEPRRKQKRAKVGSDVRKPGAQRHDAPTPEVWERWVESAFALYGARSPLWPRAPYAYGP